MVSRYSQRLTIIIYSTVLTVLSGCTNLNPFSKSDENAINITPPEPISLTCDYPFAPFKDFFLRRQSDGVEISEDQTAWIAYPKVRYSLDQLPQALDNIVSSMGERRKIILYVHGRGEYPEKAFDEDILKRLEAEYNAEVLMFTWPSWLGRNTLPDKNAEQASQYLAKALNIFNEYKQNNRARMNNLRVTLIAHSVGNRLLKGVLEDYSGGLESGLFSSVILSAPDVALDGHTQWLSKLDFAKNSYVFSNCNDPVLNSSRKERNQTILGQQLTLDNETRIKLADNATYIVVDNASQAHRYFISGGRTAFLARVFEGIMNDQQDPLDNNAVQAVRGNQVYKFRPLIFF